MTPLQQISAATLCGYLRVAFGAPPEVTDVRMGPQMAQAVELVARERLAAYFRTPVWGRRTHG